MSRKETRAGCCRPLPLAWGARPTQRAFFSFLAAILRAAYHHGRRDHGPGRDQTGDRQRCQATHVHHHRRCGWRRLQRHGVSGRRRRGPALPVRGGRHQGHRAVRAFQAVPERECRRSCSGAVPGGRGGVWSVRLVRWAVLLRVASPRASSSLRSCLTRAVVNVFTCVITRPHLHRCHSAGSRGEPEKCWRAGQPDRDAGPGPGDGPRSSARCLWGLSPRVTDVALLSQGSPRSAGPVRPGGGPPAGGGLLQHLQAPAPQEPHHPVKTPLRRAVGHPCPTRPASVMDTESPCTASP